MSAILVLSGVDRDGLEATPANGEGEGVACLEHLRKPAVPLQAQLQETTAFLHGRQPADQQRLRRCEVLHQLAR